MKETVPASVIHHLKKREQENSLRTLKRMDHLIDFSSNDYLGLARNRDLQGFLLQDETNQESKLGGTGSRLISGQHEAYEHCESFLSEVFDAEKVLLYNSGYAASQGVVASIPQRGDTILYDQLAHVCLKEGAWLSKASSVSFRHNDLQDLERRLGQAEGAKYVVTETVFSMDGDVAPVAEIISLCEAYDAWLIIDEAHSTGLYDAKGGGLLVDQKLHDHVLARIYTFGKAMGTHGAAVASDARVIDYLINFSRTFIYTTSLPPKSVSSIQRAFEFLAQNTHLQQALDDKIILFRKHYKDSISTTAIQPIMIPGNEKARNASQALQQQGFDVRAILGPTVPVGAERLRISLHVHNSDEEIKQLAEALLSVK